MKRLKVWIEKKGEEVYVGHICGTHAENAVFTYSQEYMNDSDNRPISIHLPFSDAPFSVCDTRNFFEGLLPEGFTRKCVAGWLHADVDDYLTLLSALGKECLGAIIGLGETMAMKHFDHMANEFSHALNLACDTLMQLGFEKAYDIKMRISKKRGI